MLVAFHSSPFSAPLQSSIPNRGFELDVDILFADSDSYDFAKGSNNKCEFHVNASSPGKWKIVLSTCRVTKYVCEAQNIDKIQFTGIKFIII